MSDPTKLRTQEWAGASWIPSRPVCRKVGDKDSCGLSNTSPNQDHRTRMSRWKGPHLCLSYFSYCCDKTT